MNNTVRTYETRNNTYHLIRTVKTTYEQQQERKAELKYMLVQKSIGLLVLIFSILVSTLLNDPEINGFLLLIFLPIGLMLLITKQHVLNISEEE